MSASQARIAETLEHFYTADRTSDVRHFTLIMLHRLAWLNFDDACVSLQQSAMAGHAYKSVVEELDNIVSRDLVSITVSDAPLV